MLERVEEVTAALARHHQPQEQRILEAAAVLREEAEAAQQQEQQAVQASSFLDTYLPAIFMPVPSPKTTALSSSKPTQR